MAKFSYKNFKRQIADLGASLCFTITILISRVLPPKILIIISRALAVLAFYLLRKYRERVVENLSIAFGEEKDLKEIKRLAREIFFHVTLTLFETVYACVNPFEKFLLKIKIKGKTYLDDALVKGKGVIALGIHLGPFTLLGARLALEGYPFNVIISKGNFPRLWERLDDYQTRLNQKSIPLKPTTSSIKKSLNCLHRNEILYILADEYQKHGGLPVPFFGQTAFTPPGPAIFSLKTGAPVLPMFIIRENGSRRTLIIRGPIEIEPTSDKRNDVERLTAKFTEVIEETVRQYPGQWAWLNRRWRWPRQKRAL